MVLRYGFLALVRGELISAGRPKKRGKTFTPLMFFQEITMTLQLKKGDFKF
jgi:hypothetical protein